MADDDQNELSREDLADIAQAVEEFRDEYAGPHHDANRQLAERIREVLRGPGDRFAIRPVDPSKRRTIHVCVDCGAESLNRPPTQHRSHCEPLERWYEWCERNREENPDDPMPVIRIREVEVVEVPPDV